MPIVDLFSSRQKKDRQSGDVWEYEQIPPVHRMQISNIVEGALGPVRDYGYSAAALYKLIHDTIAHEHGRARWSAAHNERPSAQVLACIRTEPDVIVWLDIVEVSLRCIVNVHGRLDE